MVNVWQRGHKIKYGREYHRKMSTADQSKKMSNLEYQATSFFFYFTFVQEMIRSTKMG